MMDSRALFRARRTVSLFMYGRHHVQDTTEADEKLAARRERESIKELIRKGVIRNE